VALCTAFLLSAVAGPAGAGARARTKVVTDGLLTVGAQETLRVKHVPRFPHMRLKASIAPPSAADFCYAEPPIDLGFFFPCFPEPLYPVPGTKSLKRNKKGRASLTFVMPAAYEFIDLNDPVRSHPIYLVDGQSVFVQITVIYRPHPRSVSGESLASVSVPVQVPAPPAT
jgi:hypothetical protein